MRCANARPKRAAHLAMPPHLNAAGHTTPAQGAGLPTWMRSMGLRSSPFGGFARTRLPEITTDSQKGSSRDLVHNGLILLTSPLLMAFLATPSGGATEGIDIGKKIKAMTIFVCTTTLYVMTKR